MVKTARGSSHTGMLFGDGLVYTSPVMGNSMKPCSYRVCGRNCYTWSVNICSSFKEQPCYQSRGVSK